jgi:hypothetical protein
MSFSWNYDNFLLVNSILLDIINWFNNSIAELYDIVIVGFVFFVNLVVPSTILDETEIINDAFEIIQNFFLHLVKVCCL